MNFAVHIMILRRKLAEMFIADFQRVQGVGGVGEFGMEIIGGYATWLWFLFKRDNTRVAEMGPPRIAPNQRLPRGAAPPP